MSDPRTRGWRHYSAWAVIVRQERCRLMSPGKRRVATPARQLDEVIPIGHKDEAPP